MQRIHAYRLVDAFERVLSATAEVVKPSPSSWGVRVELAAGPVVFDDVDRACEYLVSRWWL